MDASDASEEEYRLLPTDQSDYGRDYERDGNVLFPCVLYCFALIRELTGKQNSLQRHTSKLVIGLCIASFAAIFFHLSVLGFQGYQMHLSSRKSSDEPLEFKSSYFGLDGIVRDPNTPPPPPVMNFPLVMAQIDSANPDRIIPYARGHLTVMGTIYSDDRTLQITSQVRVNSSSP